MLNHIIIMGRLTRDPELRRTGSGVAVTSFTLAVDEWGKRRLAYEINDLTEGYYVLMNMETKPEFPAELERVMKITEGVMRVLTTAVEG